MKPHERGRTPNPFHVFWRYADDERRLRGALIEGLGFGPETTPAHAVGTWSTARLLAYEPSGGGPAVVIVPAPIKAAYIWDLAPDVSAVRRCLDAGLRVYLIEWQPPRTGDEALGLADYADRLIGCCLDAAAQTARALPFLAGHSLGGTLAAVFASLHPDRVAGLVALEAPIRFTAEAGHLESVVHALPAAGAHLARDRAVVPGSLLSAAAAWADPVAFKWEPWLDWIRSQRSPAAARRYWRVLRWVLNELPMPARLFEEIVEQLYREDRFARRVLRVGGRLADPRALVAPILAVADSRSRMVPAESVNAFGEATGSADVTRLEYTGDTGVLLQHLGVLIGEQAHRSLWPRILDWVHARASRV